MGGPLQFLRLAYRTAKRLLKWIFLITLPLHLVYLTVGFLDGYFFDSYEYRMYYSSHTHYLRNIAETMGPVTTAPYWIPQIRNPTTWWEDMGFTRFDHDPEVDYDRPADEFADLTSLYRKLPRHKTCFRHWLYASNNHIDQQQDGFRDIWDEAFNQLLQYHYAQPSPCNARFHYISCRRSFLCDIWKTRGPALIHFTTETADLWPDNESIFGQDVREAIYDYAPVTARIIEFPITDQEEMTLSPGTFPTPFEQLKGVTSYPYIWQAHIAFSKWYQYALRLWDIHYIKTKEFPNSMGRWSELKDWLAVEIDGATLLKISTTGFYGVGFLLGPLPIRVSEYIMKWVDLFIGRDKFKKVTEVETWYPTEN